MKLAAAEASDNKIPVVTMITKQGRRAVENSAEIMSHLQVLFPWARYQMLKGDKISSMTLQDQV